MRRIVVDYWEGKVGSTLSAAFRRKTNRELLPDPAPAEWRSMRVCVGGPGGARGQAVRVY